MCVTGTQSSWQSDPNQLQGHSNAPNPLSKAFWSWPYLACDEGSQESGRQSRPKPVGDGYLSCQDFSSFPSLHQRILPNPTKLKPLPFESTRIYRHLFTMDFDYALLADFGKQAFLLANRTTCRANRCTKKPRRYATRMLTLHFISPEKQVNKKTPCKWVKPQPPFLLTLWMEDPSQYQGNQGTFRIEGKIGKLFAGHRHTSSRCKNWSIPLLACCFAILAFTWHQARIHDTSLQGLKGLYSHLWLLCWPS